jgi:hypothetical protein
MHHKSIMSGAADDVLMLVFAPKEKKKKNLVNCFRHLNTISLHNNNVSITIDAIKKKSNHISVPFRHIKKIK